MHSIVFAGLFALAVGRTGCADSDSSTGRGAGLDLGYGAVVLIVAAGFVMPIWLKAIGAIGGGTLPNVNPQSLVGHLVYGLVLDTVYPKLFGVVE